MISNIPCGSVHQCPSGFDCVIEAGSPFAIGSCVAEEGTCNPAHGKLGNPKCNDQYPYCILGHCLSTCVRLCRIAVDADFPAHTRCSQRCVDTQLCVPGKVWSSTKCACGDSVEPTRSPTPSVSPFTEAPSTCRRHRCSRHEHWNPRALFSFSIAARGQLTRATPRRVCIQIHASVSITSTALPFMHKLGIFDNCVACWVAGTGACVSAVRRERARVCTRARTPRLVGIRFFSSGLHGKTL